MNEVVLNNKNENGQESERMLSRKMVQALSHSLFPALDSALRSGRHVGLDDLDQYAFLSEYQMELEQFYRRYHVELVRAPESFYYLRPRATTLIPRSVLSELEMLIGKVLCYLYLSPERLAQEGVFTLNDLYDELITLVDKTKLLKMINQRAVGTDLDQQKLFDKVKSSLNRLRRLGMVTFLSIQEPLRFTIHESVFRFGADVRSADLQEAQLRLIRDGEAILLTETEEAPLADDDAIHQGEESITDSQDLNERLEESEQ